MRFKLYLRPIQQSQKLIFNYQYPLQAWLYGRLHQADAAYAHFLHQQGYKTAEGNKTFKHFTFSSLLNVKTAPIKKGDSYMTLKSDVVEWVVSFYVDKAAESFVVGLFQNQQLSIYNRDHRTDFIVERVESLPELTLGKVCVFKTMSPLVVAEKTNGLDQYLSPIDASFARFFAVNLVDKYRSLQTEPTMQLDAETAERLVKFELLSDTEHIKKRGFLAKEGKDNLQTKVIGYHNFTFKVTAPPELLEVGYLGGFGKYSSMGCGCVEVVG